jgi:hypothetical protein
MRSSTRDRGHLVFEPAEKLAYLSRATREGPLPSAGPAYPARIAAKSRRALAHRARRVLISERKKHLSRLRMTW